MNAVDTNVLIYARDPRYPEKYRKARDLTANLQEAVLLWQVACEFIAASRKLTEVSYTQAQAWRELEELRGLWTLIMPTEGIIPRAEQLTATTICLFGIQCWWRRAWKVESRACTQKILTLRFRKPRGSTSSIRFSRSHAIQPRFKTSRSTSSQIVYT